MIKITGENTECILKFVDGRLLEFNGTGLIYDYVEMITRKKELKHKKEIEVLNRRLVNNIGGRVEIDTHSKDFLVDTLYHLAKNRQWDFQVI